MNQLTEQQDDCLTISETPPDPTIEEQLSSKESSKEPSEELSRQPSDDTNDEGTCIPYRHWLLSAVCCYAHGGFYPIFTCTV